MERPSRPPSISIYFFIACGVSLVGLGLYFMLLRPTLLPEDVRYIGGRLSDVRAAVPRFDHWLHRVFIVTGGFMAGAGILTIFVSLNSATARRRWRWPVLAVVGLLTVGLMTTVNFEIDSDFKLLLLVPTVLWILALALSAVETR